MSDFERKLDAVLYSSALGMFQKIGAAYKKMSWFNKELAFASKNVGEEEKKAA